MCVYFLKLIEKLDVDVRRSRGEVYKAARDRSCFRLKASLYPKEDRKRQKKKQWDEDHRRISVARDVHNSWRTMKCMCVYSSDTAFAQHLLSLEMRLRVG